MESLMICSTILTIWGMAAMAGRSEKRRKQLEVMSDDELITAMHGPLRFDNLYRREYARRHPFVAPAPEQKVREIAYSVAGA